MEYVKITQLKPREDNPRVIGKQELDELVTSITSLPAYFEARPILVSDRTGELVIIAGHQRYKAAIKAKMKTVPIHIMSGLTESQEKEIMIRDNVAKGEWDWNELANWDDKELDDWGLKMEFNSDQLYDLKGQKTDTTKITIEKTTDDNYSNFDIVLLYVNKLFIQEVLQKVKKDHAFEKVEDALMYVFREFDKIDKV